jgi:ABC-type transport system involved in multi-copper enzyme maturation permease subunit
LLAKPLNRFDILLGKILACVTMSVGSYLLFVGLTLVAVPMVPGQGGQALAQVVSLQALGLSLLVVVSMGLSLYCPSVVSALVSLSWYFGGGLVLNLVRDSISAKRAVLTPVAERAISLVPDATQLFHSECFANHWGALSNTLHIHLMLYGAAWTLFFFLWANWRFSRMRP